MTQGELADLVGLSRASITNIELGRQSVLVDQLCRFAAVLGVTPADLLQCAPARREERSTEDLTPDAAAWIDRVRRKVA
jgi:transcriptional regulator with XRE-family HTH domain